MRTTYSLSLSPELYLILFLFKSKPVYVSVQILLWSRTFHFFFFLLCFFHFKICLVIWKYDISSSLCIILSAWREVEFVVWASIRNGNCYRVSIDQAGFRERGLIKCKTHSLSSSLLLFSRCAAELFPFVISPFFFVFYFFFMLQLLLMGLIRKLLVASSHDLRNCSYGQGYYHCGFCCYKGRLLWSKVWMLLKRVRVKPTYLSRSLQPWYIFTLFTKKCFQKEQCRRTYT